MIRTFIILIFLLNLFNCSQKKDIDTDESKTYLLNSLDSKDTGINFKNQIIEDIDHSIINYIYYYNGAGVASGDINNDGLPDLYFVSNMGENKLYLNKGNLKFEDISKKANVNTKASWNTGATMVDINNDGWLDIYVCAVSGLLDFKGHNELFINNGDGTFTERSVEYGLNIKGYSTQAYFFDFDKDDDLDVYIVNHAVHTTLSHGPANVRKDRKDFIGDMLMQNNDGNFIDVSEDANIYGGVNGYGLSASIADFNNDGWEDIYVCNDFHEDDYYYENNKDGTFTEKLDETFSTISRFSMGSDAADLNGDGFQDLITLDMLPFDEKALKETEGDDAMFTMRNRLNNLGYKDQWARNMLQINNDGEYFHETALVTDIAATDWSWGPLFADFNNDGHQDLFVANGIMKRPNSLDFKMYVANAFANKSPQDGLKWLYRSKDEMPSGKVSNLIFEGNNASFSSQLGNWIDEEPTLSNGAIYVDLDLDGDLEIVLNNLNQGAMVYMNSTKADHGFIQLKFKYKPQNGFGVGTKAKVYSNGKVQLKQLINSRGFLSSVDNTLHFGLGQANQIDSILIIWPDNKFQVEYNPEVNQLLSISYNPKEEDYEFSQSLSEVKLFKEESVIDFKHEEDSYIDFLEDKLIPYKVSTLGPAVAKGDIDNNGFEDLFLGNSAGHPSKIVLNTGSSFNEKKFEVILKDSIYEDNAAEFFDADGDGKMDLYVASGLHELRIKTFHNNRLYLQKSGGFVRSAEGIPADFLNTSCVKAEDYDLDGDVDLFIGNLSDPFDFGKRVESYILDNDGNGNFTKNPNFKVISNVNNAMWADINGDDRMDLLIATEWDVPKVYLNQENGFTEVTLPENLSGLWQTVTVYDIDKDGDNDILLGNWGLNTKFNPTPDRSLKMFHGDFDKNGKTETVLTYNKNGVDYPVHSKDELAAQMTIINKRFVTHSEYALKPIDDVLTKEAIDASDQYEVRTLASGFIENNSGEYTNFVPFARDLQLGLISDFENIEMGGENGMIISGNSHKLNTYHGVYNSLKGYFLSDLSKGPIPIYKFGISPFNEQIKDLVTLKMRDKNILVVVPNNSELKTYSFPKTKAPSQ